MPKNKKILTRIIAIFVVLTLIFSYSSILINQFVSYAVTDKLGKQPSSNTHNNVSFDAYFVSNNENKGYQYETEISNEDVGIKLKLDVKKAGYLKNASITLKAEDGLNYSLADFEQNNLIESVEGNKVKLNQINNGESLDFVIPISYKDTNKIDNLNKNTTVELSGTYIDNSGESVKIVENVILNLVWLSNTQLNLESNLTKYIPYNSDSQKGVIIQTVIKASLEDNNIPVEKIEIQSDSIKIDGLNLESMTVLSNTRDDFTDNNWNYDEETGKITISVQNHNQEGQVNNFEEEEFLITYVFSGDENKDLPITLNSKITGLISMYGTSETITGQAEGVYEIKEKVGDIVTYSTKSSTEKLSKGNILANKYNEEKEYISEYETKSLVNVSTTDLIDKIVLKDIEENFEDIDGNKYSTENTSFYKKIKVSKTDFDNMFGESGKITIRNLLGDEVYEINKSSNVEESFYVINFEDKMSKIEIETTKPINSGNLNIETVKNIKETDYSEDQIKGFVNINSKKLGNVYYNNVESKIGEIENKIELTDTQTNAVLSINKESLGTIVKNENVELKVELNNDKLGTDFYKNPKFEIILPSYIEEIEIKNVAIANGDDNFKISSIDAKVENSRVVIRVNLEGLQNKYSLSNLTNGTNLIINTDMTLNLYTPSIEEKVILNYSNEIATKYASEENGIGRSEATIKYTAPTGLVSVNTISNYNNKGNKITSVEQGIVTDKIDIYDEEKIATMEILSINNNNYDCTDIKILGRIPFKGNKDVSTGKDLGTNIDTTLVGKIKSNSENKANCIIYYSENPEATEDLNNPQNNWNVNITDYSKIKSYLIVCQDYTMKTGDILRFTYDYKIPANLEHNAELYGSFETLYNSKERISQTQEESVADIVGLVTGAGPQLSMETSVDIGNGSTVKEYEKIKYSIKVTNTGTDVAENIQITTPIPEWTTLVRYKKVTSMANSTGWETLGDKVNTVTIDSLKPEESKIIEFYVQINKLPTIEEYYSSKEGFTKNSDGTYSIFEEYVDENGETKYRENKLGTVPDISIECESTLTAKDLAKPLKSNLVTNKAEKAVIIADETIETQESIVKENEELLYTINVKNTSNDTLNNIKVTKVLPKELSYSESYILEYDKDGITPIKINTNNYDMDSRTVTWTIDSLEKNKSKKLKLVVYTAKLDNEVYEKDVVTSSTVNINNEQYSTAETSITVAKPKLVVNQESDKTNMYIKEGEDINYTFSIKNEGKIKADNLELIDKLPSELKIKKLSYTIDGVEMSKVVSKNEDATVSTSILPNSDLTVKVTATANSITDKEKQISNSGIIKVASQEIETNSINNIIEKTSNKTQVPQTQTQNQTPNSNSNEKISNTYKIRGTAWLDTNRNGQHDSGDTGIEGMEVRLINSKTGEVVKYTATVADGQYIFDNIGSGLYYIMFFYNSEKYGITDYKKQNIKDDVNSDVISTQIEEKGRVINVGLTDTIEISNGSVSNIDIGLVEASTFDLSLEKTVSKITVQNKDGVKVQEFNDVTLAKIDIPAKKLANTKVLVEYKMTIKNQGDVAGYAKQIIDYKPSQMEFNPELNPNWYEGSDGNIYTNELENTIINPGETKVVTLILSKQMTEDNTGLVNNTAEISISYNTSGISDKDSTPKNKVQGEDDLGSADVILSVNTGDSLIYISAIIVIAIVGMVAIYFIRKNRYRLFIRRGGK